MADRMIQCQHCSGSGWWIIPDGENMEIQCPVCDGSGTIPDRRRETPNDRIVERVKEYMADACFDAAFVPQWIRDFRNIIREEAERNG